MLSLTLSGYAATLEFPNMTNKTTRVFHQQLLHGETALKFFCRDGEPSYSIVQLWGFIPLWLDGTSSESFMAQVGKNYSHGGGWRPLAKATAGREFSYKYPGDPRQRASSMFYNPTTFEVIVMHEYAFFSVWKWMGSEEHSLAVQSIIAGNSSPWSLVSVARID